MCAGVSRCRQGDSRHDVCTSQRLQAPQPLVGAGHTKHVCKSWHCERQAHLFLEDAAAAEARICSVPTHATAADRPTYCSQVLVI